MSAAQRAAILTLRAAGKSCLKIAATLGIGRDVVAGIVRRSKEAPGEAKARRYAGHPQPKGPRDAERTAEAVRLFSDEGLSYRAIALRLDMSRNAVAGVVTRAGVLRRDRAAPPEPQLYDGVVQLPEPRDMSGPRWAAVMAIGPLQCRYPHGDPRKRDFHFCGKPTKLGKSWCPEHQQVVFPSQLRQRFGATK